ncbi:MAG: hypothetical protein OXC07_03160 [Kistimonas sp.]|nr:hypothetical protein [Kistimonas sp.]
MNIHSEKIQKPAKLLASETVDSSAGSGVPGSRQALARQTASVTNLSPQEASGKHASGRKRKLLACAYAQEGCKKLFLSKFGLDRHERTHTKKELFGCTYTGCDKKFFYRLSLLQHKKIHTREQPCSDKAAPQAPSTGNSRAIHRKPVHASDSDGSRVKDNKPNSRSPETLQGPADKEVGKRASAAGTSQSSSSPLASASRAPVDLQEAKGVNKECDGVSRSPEQVRRQPESLLAAREAVETLNERICKYNAKLYQPGAPRPSTPEHRLLLATRQALLEKLHAAERSVAATEKTGMAVGLASRHGR